MNEYEDMVARLKAAAIDAKNTSYSLSMLLNDAATRIEFLLHDRMLDRAEIVRLRRMIEARETAE